MFDVGFSEFALIIVAGFVCIGPKELPQVIRTLSKWFYECRKVIDECRSQIDAMMKESGLKETLSEVKNEIAMEKKYITDQYGELREVYDVTDIVMERKAQDASNIERQPPTQQVIEDLTPASDRSAKAKTSSAPHE